MKPALEAKRVILSYNPMDVFEAYEN